MIIIRDLMQKRPDIKIILMSATLNAEHFAAYFGQRTFPSTTFDLVYLTRCFILLIETLPWSAF